VTLGKVSLLTWQCSKLVFPATRRLKLATLSSPVTRLSAKVRNN
jgi:hypothetical protein